MPIPQKRKDEDSQKFMSRCMSDPTMQKEYKDNKQRVAICIQQTRADLISKNEMIKQFANLEWDEEWGEWVEEIDVFGDIIDSETSLVLSTAAENKGKKVKLGKVMRGDVKKYKVYVKNDKGNVVKVNFGDKNMEIKRDDPERRKNFRARHNCDNPGPRWKAKYWSCKLWSRTKVSDIV